VPLLLADRTAFGQSSILKITKLTFIGEEAYFTRQAPSGCLEFRSAPVATFGPMRRPLRVRTTMEILKNLFVDRWA